MKTPYKCLIGITSGLLNGLFGSGGGVVAVPLLEKSNIEQRKCHATSVVLIFILSIVSTVMYAVKDNLDHKTALTFIPAGIVGAVIGAGILKKIDNSLLRRVFGVIILISAVRMIVM
ncbi:MAG: sulfite exporter TauE/SafE family protein [Oscillospiraceae bacterium]|nr:sulfite exporter TauE/SafE family protein [Oscillospiraceae bacterium]